MSRYVPTYDHKQAEARKENDQYWDEGVEMCKFFHSYILLYSPLVARHCSTAQYEL